MKYLCVYVGLERLVFSIVFDKVDCFNKATLAFNLWHTHNIKSSYNNSSEYQHSTYPV